MLSFVFGTVIAIHFVNVSYAGGMLTGEDAGLAGVFAMLVQVLTVLTASVAVAEFTSYGFLWPGLVLVSVAISYVGRHQSPLGTPRP